ncbi:GSCOCG00011010001-RA-CDS [Cotesia congregata]|nr:GSCOCG00011010001-RA-CDS [Cotesia congregata]
MSNVLSQKMINSIINQLVVDLFIIEQLGIIVFVSLLAEVGLDRTVSRGLDDKLFAFEWFKPALTSGPTIHGVGDNKPPAVDVCQV